MRQNKRKTVDIIILYFVLSKNSRAFVVSGKLYTIGGVQAKGVDQYDVETDTWSGFFPSLRHCRVAHGAVADGDTLYVTGGSAKVVLGDLEII